MDDHIRLLSRIAQPGDGKIVLLVLDGVGDIRTADQPRTALEMAETPVLDALASRSALGRVVPVARGITPGSGPGHLALFGYDPTSEEADIGRGALEALGVGIDFGPGDVVARGNFATIDGSGKVADRRAGRISSKESRRIVEKLNRALGESSAASGSGLSASVHAGEGHRFVLLLEGDGLSPKIADTDPQEVGEPPRPLEATDDAARETVERLEPVLRVLRKALEGEAQANGFLLRGFDTLPHLPDLSELYGLSAGCFAGYPLYRGAARLVGMEVVEVGKTFADAVEGVRRRWRDFDFLFLHVKDPDKAGEDGDLPAKVRSLETVDAELPELLGLLDTARDVIAITGDHSTPAPMKAHSWHPVPLLVNGPYCFVDDETAFTEPAANRGHLGTMPSRELMGLLLANAGWLAKFGA
jgi:2,3-bisphosphoglycerate-independent phosphoglycerate mutase